MTALVRRSLLVLALVLVTALVTAVVLTGVLTGADRSPEGPLDAPVGTAADRARDGWTGTWSAAVTEAGEGVSAEGFTDTTLRQVAHVSLGGDRLRVRLSNAYGDAPLEVGALTVAVRRGGGPTPRVRDLRPATFSGRPSAVVPPGAELLSDPVALAVPAGSDVVVSLHLPGPTGPATWHAAGHATSYAARGDATTDAGDRFAVLDRSRYFLTGLDVAGTAGPDGRAAQRPGRRAGRITGQGAVVFLGDSITDGADSTPDADRRYPDLVADRLERRPPARRCGVLNVGIGGNRLLADGGPQGDSVLARLDRDVLARPGARSVVVLAGINDVRAGDVTAAELVAAHRQVVARARGAGLRVVGATLLPFGGSGRHTDAGEAVRQGLNRWIRTSGAYDDVVDLDAALRDPGDPERLDPRWDSGDRLHPDDAGYARMAAEVDLDAVC